MNATLVMNMADCTIGLQLNDACNMQTYCRKPGLYKLSDLTDESRNLLFWRSGVTIENLGESTICYHHEKIFISRYESLQIHCADPLSRHKTHIKSKHVTICPILMLVKKVFTLLEVQVF